MDEMPRIQPKDSLLPENQKHLRNQEAISDYYSQITDLERNELAAWGDFAIEQLGEDDPASS